jgi:hypothetical protein
VTDTPELCGFQDAPASVVFKMVPESPTAYPVVSSSGK